MKKIIERGVLLSTLLFFSFMGNAQEWQVVRENVQKSFHKTVPAGNYSGITHLYDDIYAVVSDKSDSALYFNFRIQVNPVTGVMLSAAANFSRGVFQRPLERIISAVRLRPVSAGSARSAGVTGASCTS